MNGEIDFEILENEAIDGRLFLQFFSGDLSSQCKIDCLNRLCTLQGRMKLTKGSRQYIWHNYTFTLEMARAFSVQPIESEAEIEHLPPGVRMNRATVVEASDFPYNLPVEKIKIIVINGTYEAHSPVQANEISKQVNLLKVHVEFKPLELITRPPALAAYTIEEVVFDKLTILRGRLNIPRPFTYNVDVFDISGTPPSSGMKTLHRSPGMKSVFSPTKRSSPSKSETLNWLQRVSGSHLSIELFVFFLSVLLWLIVRSYLLTAQNYHHFTLYTVLFVVFAALGIFSFRGTILKTLLTQFAPPECNGRTFFVNGWNTWSFCGCVLQGHAPPVYSMPSMFVKAFHDGGVGTALHINLGQGTAPVFGSSGTSGSGTSSTSSGSDKKVDPVVRDLALEGMHSHSDEKLFLYPDGVRRPAPIITSGDSGENPSNRHQHMGGHSHFMPPSPSTSTNVDIVSSASDYAIAAKDYVASDMFTIIADNRSKVGIVMGFLSQKQQFGCIATNRNYDRVSVHVSGDGAVVCSNNNTASHNTTTSTTNAYAATNTYTGTTPSTSTTGKIETDWLCLYVVNTLTDPFKVYMSMSARVNQVKSRKGFNDDTDTTEVFVNTPNPLKHNNTLSFLASKTTSDTNTTNTTNYFVTNTTSNSITNTTTIATTNTNTCTTTANDTAVPVGWCSWYHYYANISERVLLENLSYMKHLCTINHLTPRQSFRLFQIDDGYQCAWGDWCNIDVKKFPSLSLTGLVKQIKEANFVPGLWMAPFSCDKHSQIAKLHPEWILKQNNTTSAANSANCGKFFYGLDTTHPGVQNHIRTCINTATTVWGFQYLKLDFLYSAVLADSLATRFDRTLTHAQIMQQAMGLVRECAGDEVYLLGCGAPLGSLIGYVDANRVSADAGMSWNPDFPLPRSDKWNLPCARNCVRNTLTRLFMHRQWWINDPDCLMLRDNLTLSLDEIRGIATAKALSGGSLIISDDLKAVSSERLRVALQLMPPVGVAAVAVDLLERETPELFRMQLRSNYAHALLLHANTANIAPFSPQKGVNGANFSPDANVTPEKPSRVRRESSVELLESSVEVTRPSQVRFHAGGGGGSGVIGGNGGSNGLFGRDGSPVKRATSAPLMAGGGGGGDGPVGSSGSGAAGAGQSSVGLSISTTNLPLQTLHVDVSAGFNVGLNGNTNSTNTDSACNSPGPDPGSGPGARLHTALAGSPRGSRARHTQEKGLIFQAGADLNLLRRERRKVKEFLKEENLSNEDDLLGEYTLFTVCNWSEAAKKDHFLSVRQIFGEEYIAQLVARGVLVNNLIKLQRASASSKARREQKLLAGLSGRELGHRRERGRERTISPERLQRGISQLADAPHYLMHLFNFWTMHYSYRVVTLEEAQDSEIAFQNIPRHSAHIYSVSLTTDPTLPKYIGSNLHFSCGSELHRIFLTTVPAPAEAFLRNVLQAQDLSPFDDLNSPQAFEPDFTFDGLEPDAENPAEHAHSLNHLDDGPTLSPVIRSLHISFEDGALRDAAWGGYIWLFLPVNGLNPRMTHSSLGRIHVSGPAVEGLYPSFSQSQQDPRRGISSHRSEEENVRLEKHVAAPDCRIHGDVYRIAVSRKNNNNTAGTAQESPDRRKSAFFFTNETKESQRQPLSRTNSLQDVMKSEQKDHIVVSWVYDVRESHTKGSVV